MKKRLLLVEDDLNLGILLLELLEIEGFEVRLCRDGEAGADAFTNLPPFDICILDCMLPKKDGFSLAREIRIKDNDVPIIFLTAKGMKEDKVKGFKIGADDYITKPFHEEELICRINVILKRNQKQQEAVGNKAPLKIGDYLFDYKNQALILNNVVNKRMTQRECNILNHLYLHKNQLLKREDILISVWGENDYFLGRSLDVFITKLRKYLKDDPRINIENIHGVGFILKIPIDLTE